MQALARAQRISKHPRSERHGPLSAFTLVELLVVIAIIALLAALLLPALSKARFEGQNAVCRSNLRQLSMAITLYASSYDVYPPWSAWDSSDGQIGVDWMYLLDATKILPRQSKVYQCPMYQGVDMLVMSQQGATSTFHLTPHDSPSYGYNQTGVGGVYSPFGLGGWARTWNGKSLFNVTELTKENEIKQPSNMVAYADYAARTTTRSRPVIILDGLQNIAPIADFLMTAFQNYTPYQSQPTFRKHHGWFNKAFCDNHIEFENFNRFRTIDDDYLRQFNKDNEPHRSTWMGP